MAQAYTPINTAAYKADFYDAEASHVLIDVREPDEYAQARIPGAILIPLGQVEARMGEIPADKPVILVCRSGGRSAMAAQMLRANQFGGELYNLEGGTMGWVQAGHTYDKGD